MPGVPDNPNLALFNKLAELEQRLREVQTQTATVVTNAAGEAVAVVGNLQPTTGLKSFGFAILNSKKEWEQLTGGGGGSGLLSGMIMAWGAAAAPSGWLLCEGQAVSRTTFKSLFEAIGTTFGEGDKSTTFNLPEGKNRVLIGAGTHALGATGGEENVTLTEAQMPKHTHEDEGHAHEPEGGGSFVLDKESGAGTKFFGTAGTKVFDVAKTALAKAKLKAAGSGSSHTNMQPYFVGNWIIKT